MKLQMSNEIASVDHNKANVLNTWIWDVKFYFRSRLGPLYIHKCNTQ
jgi:hypothetical protein